MQREREVAALTESVELSILRYRQGLSSYYEVLDAHERLYPAQRQLVGVQRDRLTAVVGLYRALGGGWQLDASWLPQP